MEYLVLGNAAADDSLVFLLYLAGTCNYYTNCKLTLNSSSSSFLSYPPPLRAGLLSRFAHQHPELPYSALARRASQRKGGPVQDPVPGWGVLPRSHDHWRNTSSDSGEGVGETCRLRSRNTGSADRYLHLPPEDEKRLLVHSTRRLVGVFGIRKCGRG